MKKSFLFLGFTIPHDEMQKVFLDDINPQVQDNKFTHNLIQGIEFFGDYDITYVCTRPISDFPYYPKKFIKKQEWIVRFSSKALRILEIPFINTSILKVVTRFFSGFYYSLKEFRKKKNKCGVIVYSVHVPFMAIGFIISKIYQVELIGIWTDPPSVITQRESKIKTNLRGVELALSKWLMNRFSRVIVLTKHLANDFAPGKPSLVIEGIINEQDLSTKISKNVKDKDTIQIVYTGSLKQAYGIQQIIEGILMTKNKDIFFEIYGRGDFENQILKIADSHNNIKYKGWVPNEVALKAQRDADFLINARSPEDEYVKYSFPSKTLEYMLSGTPLITTLLPGMPEEYSQYVIPLQDNKPESIRDTLQMAFLLNSEERVEIGERAKLFAKTKNYQIQGRKIVDFLEKI